MKQIITHLPKLLILVTICGLIVFSGLNYCFAQNKKIDSLNRLLRKSKEDTNKVQLLVNLTKQHIQKRSEKVDYFIQQSLKLSKKLNYQKGIGEVYNIMGISFLNKNVYDTAMYYFQEAMKIHKQNKYQKHLTHLYNNIGLVYYYQGKYSEAIQHYHKSLDLCKIIKYKKGIADALNNIGLCYDDQSKYDKALKYYFQALSIYKQLKKQYSVIAIYNNIGNIQMNQGNYEKSLEYFSKVITVSKQIGNQRIEGITLNNIGNIQMNQGKFAAALNSYFKSLKVLEELKDENMIGSVYVGIGNVFDHQGRLNKALEYFFRALKIKQQLNIKASLANIYNNIASVYDKKKQKKKSLEYYHKALSIDKEMDNQRGVAISYTNIGLIYSDQKQFQKALTNYLKALASFKLLSDKKNLAHTYNIISSIYIRQQKTEEAEKALKEAQKLAKEVGLLEYLMNNYFYFHQLDSARNKYQGALNWHKQFVILKDSIFNKEKSKQITEIQTKYETEKKEQENKLLKKDKALKESQIKAQEATIQRQNILTTGITLGALLLSFFASVFYRQRAHIRRLYGDIGHTTGNHLTLLMEMLESQKSKLQLHSDNTLMIEELDATQQVIMNIASVYGERKENESMKGKHLINVVPHVRMIANSLVDTTQHQDYPIKLILDLPDECKLTIKQALYLSMFTNEVIVNALKHAFKGHTSPQLSIQLASIEKRRYQYIIQDNGVGFPADLGVSNLDSKGLEQMRGFVKNIKGDLVVDENHQGVKYSLNF